MRLRTRFLRSLLTSSGWWIGVAVSLALHMLVAQMVEDKAAAQFDYHAHHAQAAIQARVQSYMDVLRGASALFYTNGQVTRAQFHAYVSKLHLDQSFPGITNLNVARLVADVERKAFVSAVRADTGTDPRGYPDFAIRPAGERSQYHVLTYLEPLATNLASFGFDIASSEGGMRALNYSRDTGQLVSSGRLIRIGGPYAHVGMAMRMPLYHPGMPLDTVAARRAAYYGSVGAGFDIGKLMQGALGQETMGIMRLRIFDTGRGEGQRTPGTTDPERLLFDSASPRTGDPQGSPPVATAGFFMKRIPMNVGERIWEAEFSMPSSAMLRGFDAYLPWLVLCAGIAASLLLYAIYFSLATARERAVEMAGEMTRDLRASEANLAEAQQMAHLGSWLLEPASQRMQWSTEIFRIFGFDRFQETQYDDFLRRMHPEDRERIRAGLEDTLQSSEEFRIEHRITRADGAVRWVQTIARRSFTDRSMPLRGILMDITERKETVEALRRSQELLRELTAYQDRLKEDERKRIAREIHDELGQTLLALRIDVSMLEARTGAAHPRLNAKVREALRHIDATVRTIRTLINNLRPAVLDLGLCAAIEWQVHEFRRRTGIACELVMDDKELAVDDARATTLFRVLQESLANVLRHAHASRVTIELREAGGLLAMKIADDGVGIAPGHRKTERASGLVGAEERILALNGRFAIDSAPGEGTTLTIHIPLETPAGENLSLTAC